ncbi:IPT/TIG domain-containing protein [Flavobacterium piscisymbiosum]|uniref:IPT/TIG domain-containing protein n=1 Tax=Flavobacterium piscisymbiosum TaxID=2893753 RepID=A0ABS8MLL5_9FLAO|nr:IPT/TIG domain-containing protein [Flavobacterium sp. F-30]MCC9066396.1 IPT/TIG domain-containing protein [Flavobacterium sp. F-30]
MGTNYNRIKVADLEKNQPNKILTTDTEGQLNFTDINNIRIDSYNALDYDQEGKVLDARQGKILKDLVNNKIDKGGFQGTTQDLANSIPDLNNSNLKLGSYPSTRNDGQLSTNKVLSTDASGNLKLYSLPTSTYPAPYLTEILPYSFLPNTTGNIILKGSFFTPTMTVVIQDQTVNYLEFKSDNEVNVNVTTGRAEGSFNVTLNNGISATFPKTLLIVLGTVYTPTANEWENTSLVDVNENGSVKLINHGSPGRADWNKVFNISKPFEIRMTPKRSPLGNYIGGDDYGDFTLKLIKATDGTPFLNAQFYHSVGSGVNNTNVFLVSTGTLNLFNLGGFFPTIAPLNTMRLKFVGGVMFLYMDNTLIYTFANFPTTNLKLVLQPKFYDFAEINYIELAT